MDSLLIAVAVGLVIWLLMRRAAYARARRQMAARQQSPQEMEAASPPDGGKSMPRMGIPGTITRAQMAELKAHDFEPVRQWSKEEAQLIIDTVIYFRAVILEETGDSAPPLEVQNRLLSFILTDEELRETILEWRLNRTREEEESGQIILPHDETYQRVANEIAELWEAGTEDR